MKKLLVLGLLCASAWALNAQVAEARLFCWRCNRYSTYICVRPYNAFSPVAYGHIVGDGCMPMSFGPGYCPPAPYMQQPCMPSCFSAPMCCGPQGCGPQCCESGGCLPPYSGGPSMPSYTGGPVMPVPPSMGAPMPNPSTPQFNGPMPTPAPAGAYYAPYGHAPVMRAAYYPAQAPAFNPYAYGGYQAGYNPVMPMQPYGVPNYWYNDR